MDPWLSRRLRSSCRASPTCTLKIYLLGEKVDDYVNHPIIRPSINSMAMTYELAQQPEYEDLMLATSHLTGEKINRFTHIHQ